MTQSPEINITEAVRDHQNKRQPTSKEERMRVQALLMNKGDHIKYQLSSSLELCKHILHFHLCFYYSPQPLPNLPSKI